MSAHTGSSSSETASKSCTGPPKLSVSICRTRLIGGRCRRCVPESLRSTTSPLVRRRLLGFGLGSGLGLGLGSGLGLGLGVGFRGPRVRVRARVRGR